MEVTLQEILAAREQRAAKQHALLEQYNKPLLCFTMNIPGPKKYSRDISLGFSVGKWLLQDALSGRKILYKEVCRESTGCEAYYVVDMPARQLKMLAVELEDIDPIGRLYDMDVLDTDGKKISREDMGLPRRKCLLCDNDAAVCARSRAHSLEDLTDRTGFLLYLTARQWMTEFIAVRAYLALNQEFSTTPKPGLVDKNNRGAHTDMGIKHFFASANALRPYFCRFAEAGYLTRDEEPAVTFSQLRSIGIEAEQAMYRATHGVNTHKGAIFTMGLACAAAGRLSPENWTAEKLLKQCAAMTQGLSQLDFAGITLENAKTAGEKIYAQYGITGVRGQAELGFPAVLEVGLPILRQGIKNGLSFNNAGCVTLLHLLAATDDTNLIHRSNRQTQLEVKAQMGELLKNDPFPTQEIILELDKEFIERNLSPGGSADLLALTYFLYFICGQ